MEHWNLEVRQLPYFGPYFGQVMRNLGDRLEKDTTAGITLVISPRSRINDWTPSFPQRIQSTTQYALFRLLQDSWIEVVHRIPQIGIKVLSCINDTFRISIC